MEVNICSNLIYGPASQIILIVWTFPFGFPLVKGKVCTAVKKNLLASGNFIFETLYVVSVMKCLK